MPGSELRVGGAGLGERPVAAHDRERPQARLQGVDPFEEVLRDRCSRQLAGPDRPAQLDDGPIVDWGLHLAFSGRGGGGGALYVESGDSRFAFRAGRLSRGP